MYRLVRKIRARVKTQELALLFIVLTAALFIGRGAGAWYVASGRESWLVSSVNGTGGARNGAVDGEPDDIEGRQRYTFLAAQDDDKMTNGFFSSERAGLTAPAGSLPASYLSLVSEASALEQGEGDAGNPGEAYADALTDRDYPEPGETDQQYGIPGSGALFDWDAGTDGRQGGDPGSVGRQGDDLGADDGSGRAYLGNYGIDGRAANETGAARAPGDGPDIGATEQDGDPNQPIYTVKVIYYGDRQVFRTVGKKVSVLFEENGISLTKDDKITGAYLDGVINSDLYIEIKRVTQKSVVEEIKIPSKTVYRDNAKIVDGKNKTIRNGSDGLKRVEYLISYENGVQVSKKAVKEEIITEAVNKIVEQGSSGARVGKDGTEFKYHNVIDVKCTAYTSSYEDTGKRPGDPAFGITKNGMVAKEGLVAVDPSVIPLGTKLYIAILDEGVEDYGYALAADTGGKIKGKKVDLYFDASAETLKQFGVRKAKVYILD